MATPPYHVQVIYHKWQSSAYTPGPFHQATYMKHSFMESEKKVFNVVESVSKRLDDLEKIVHNNSSSVSPCETKNICRVAPQLTVGLIKDYA